MTAANQRFINRSLSTTKTLSLVQREVLHDKFARGNRQEPTAQVIFLAQNDSIRFFKIISKAIPTETDTLG